MSWYKSIYSNNYKVLKEIKGIKTMKEHWTYLVLQGTHSLLGRQIWNNYNISCKKYIRSINKSVIEPGKYFYYNKKSKLVKLSWGVFFSLFILVKFNCHKKVYSEMRQEVLQNICLRCLLQRTSTDNWILISYCYLDKNIFLKFTKQSSLFMSLLCREVIN